MCTHAHVSHVSLTLVPVSSKRHRLLLSGTTVLLVACVVLVVSVGFRPSQHPGSSASAASQLLSSQQEYSANDAVSVRFTDLAPAKAAPKPAAKPAPVAAKAAPAPAAPVAAPSFAKPPVVATAAKPAAAAVAPAPSKPAPAPAAKPAAAPAAIKVRCFHFVEEVGPCSTEESG